jgi:hypothetical protein
MPADNFQQPPLGAWSSEELQETAHTISPPGADTDIPDEDRFRAGVTKLVQLRNLQGSSETSLAIFLLARSPENNSMGWQRAPMLDNGLTAVGGKVWLVNAPVVTGLFQGCDDFTDEDTFQFVTANLNLGMLPAIVYDPRVSTPQLRFYAHGLSSPDDYEAIMLTSGPIPLENILAEVEKIYQQHLVTPEAQSEAGKLWAKNTHWWAAKNAEKVAQLYLKVGLSRAFPNCTIREEQTQISGRIDLEVEERISAYPSLFRRHAVLELKVLRSFGSGGKLSTDEFNLNWVKKGVEQASAYRQEREALASALCCFDLRSSVTDNACFIHVHALASSLQVTLRRWYVYASSELFRAATVSQTA